MDLLLNRLFFFFYFFIFHVFCQLFFSVFFSRCFHGAFDRMNSFRVNRNRDGGLCEFSSLKRGYVLPFTASIQYFFFFCSIFQCNFIFLVSFTLFFRFYVFHYAAHGSTLMRWNKVLFIVSPCFISFHSLLIAN